MDAYLLKSFPLVSTSGKGKRDVWNVPLECWWFLGVD